MIDSVVRKWIEDAKKNGADLNIEGRGEPGTYPAAVKRITELMPALFDDILKVIPAEQKEKLEGLVRIWEKGNTFPGKLLSEFKAKLNGAATQAAAQVSSGTASQGASTIGKGEKFSAPIPSRPMYTPTGFPPQHLYDAGLIPKNYEATSKATQLPPAGQAGLQPADQAHRDPRTHGASNGAAPSDIHGILAALANTAPKPDAQQSTPRPPVVQQAAQQQLPPNIAALFAQQNLGTPSQPPSQQSQPPLYAASQAAPPYATSQAPPPFQMPPGFPSFPPQPPPSVPQQYSYPPPQPPAPQVQQPHDPLAPLRSILPQNILNDQQKLVQALKLLQDLQKDGIPMDQWGPVIEAFNQQYRPPAQEGFGAYNDYGGGRGRSRSPDRNDGRRRASPVYGTYGDSSGRNQNSEQRYRQRSPMRNSPAPTANANTGMTGGPMQPKYIAYDNTLPNDSIKVLSRTLFVGGANGTQQEIHSLFARFGQVQTCIANRDKRHAFVKMTTRAHALNARAGLEKLQAANDREVMNIARQTKWGVGFGPRECCDYPRGESTIPINKLTDADMKWLLTAEYGGTGGQKVEGGMVLEEPDIEIGAGVSSKAMSKRVLPENMPQSAKRQRDDGNAQRRDNRVKRQNDGGSGLGYGTGYSGVTGGQATVHQPPMQMEAYGYTRPEPVAVATPPAVPGFGFALPGQPNYR